MHRACTLLRGNNGTTLGYGRFLSCPQCKQNVMLVEDPGDVFERLCGGHQPVWFSKHSWFNERGRPEMLCPNHNENLANSALGSGRFQAHRLPAGIMSRVVPARRGTSQTVTGRDRATVHRGGGR